MRDVGEDARPPLLLIIIIRDAMQAYKGCPEEELWQVEGIYYNHIQLYPYPYRLLMK